jgi:dCTP deaminase
MRISDTFKVFRGGATAVIDPKNSNPAQFQDFQGDTCIIPPNSFVLATSLEYFRIPRDVLVLCFGKSTYARCGVIVNVTPLEPEWEGYVTISIVNAAPRPVKLYAREGIAQCVFIGAAEVCEVSYRDKAGKYQAQKEISLAKVDHVVEG